MAEQALAFAVAVQHFTVMEELSAAVMSAIEPFGMTAAASGLVSGTRAASPRPFHFVNWPDEWVSVYLAEQFLLIDPIPRWARNSGRPVSWGELFRFSRAGPLRKVIAAGARFGFTGGFVVPLRSGDNSLGLVSSAACSRTFSPRERILLTLIAVNILFAAADRIVHGGEIGRPPPSLPHAKSNVSHSWCGDIPTLTSVPCGTLNKDRALSSG